MPPYRDESPPRRGGTRVAEYEEDIEVSHGRRRRDPRTAFLDEDYGRDSAAGPLVVREEEVVEERRRGGSRRPPPRDEFDDRDIVDHDTIVSKPRRRDRSHSRHFEEEEIRYRGPQGPGRDFPEDDVKSRVTSRGGRDRERDAYEEEDIRFSAHRAPAPPKSSRGGFYEEDEFRYEKKAPKERPAGREEVREEVVYRGKPKPKEVVTEQWDYQPGPAVARETEEWTFAPPPRREPERERVFVTERNRSPSPESPPPKRDWKEEEIIINHRDADRRPPPPREPRGDYQEITINRDRDQSRGPPSARDYDEIKFRHTSPPPKPRSEHRGGDDIRITQRERDVDPPGPNNAYRQEDTTISFNRDGDRPRPKSVYGGESRYQPPPPRNDYRDSASFYAREKDGPRGHSDEFAFRYRDHSEPPKEREKGYEQQITIRQHDDDDTRSRAGGGREELTISRRERIPSPEPSPPPAPPEAYRPAPIRQEIHQEIITHHRHIDHGYEYRGVPPPAPPEPPKPPSPPSHDDIEIRRRGEHNGRRFEESIHIDRRSDSPTPSSAPSRPRSLGPSPRPPPSMGGALAPYRPPEPEHYRDERRDERRYDSSGGTGGGAHVNLTIVNSRREEENQVAQRPERAEDPARRQFVGAPAREESMWTEITKDLVVAEALTGCGYEFTETEHFFYVVEYLRYEDVAKLVRISDDLRNRRKERTRQIEWEAKMPPAPAPGPPEPASPPPRAISERSWDQERERIVEREYFGPSRSPAPSRMPRPPPPSGPPSRPPPSKAPSKPPTKAPSIAPSRVRERDTVVVLKEGGR